MATSQMCKASSASIHIPTKGRSWQCSVNGSPVDYLDLQESLSDYAQMKHRADAGIAIDSQDAAREMLSWIKA